MTVRKLIAELKKFPLSAEVFIQDHDAAENEISGIAHEVAEIDQATSSDPDAFKYVAVVIRIG
jgi:hypothetical protein